MGAIVESTVVIARPVEEVFAFVVDVENNMRRWNAAVESVVKTSEGPIGAGSTFQVRGHLGSRSLELSQRVTAFEPNRKIELEARGRPISPKGSLTFEPADGGTRVTFRGEPNPVGPFKLLSPLITRQGQRLWDGNLARLKSVLEASAPQEQASP